MATTDLLVRLLVIAVAVIFLVPLLIMLVMIPIMGGGFMWSTGMSGMAGGLWPWLLFWGICLLVILGVIYLIYKAILGIQDRSADAALRELRTAYARGEISSEEFEERQERLRQRQ